MFRVSDDQYIMNSSPTPFLCGELHYFRMEPEVWNERLIQLKDAGCNAVASYVPWEVHEVEEGKFDFEGSTHPRRNLKLWLHMVAASELAMFIRPGPLVYAEMVRGGWPGWLQKNYPEVESMILRDRQLVLGSDARSPEEAAVSYLHPVYLEKAGNWLRAVTDFVKPYLQTRSGPITLWQLCNEIPGMQTWLAGMDRSPEAIGMGRPEGHYPNFLRQTYGAPETLGEVYGIKCEDFAGISWECLATAKQDVVEADYASFYHEIYIPAYVQWLEKTVRDAGVDVPLTTNSGNPNEVTFQKEAAIQSPDVLFGVDCYYHLYETGLGAIGLAYLCELGASIVKECSPGPATIWEAECGYWFDYPQVEPDDIYLFLLWSYISGFKGISMYLFAGGDNWPGLCVYGNYHDWQAPIGADGTLRPHYYSIQRAMREIVNDTWVLQSNRVCDLSIGVYAQESLRGLSHFLFEGSVSYDVVDIRHTPLDEMKRKALIWLRGREEMDILTQKKILEYVAAGGNLLIDQALPSRALDHSPTSHLSRELGIELRPNDSRIPRIKIGLYEVPIDRSPAIMSGASEVLATDMLGRPALCGVAFGRGRVLMAPFDVTYKMNSQLIYLDTVMDWFGIRRVVDAKAIRGQVRRGIDGETFVYLANPYRHSVHEEIRVGENRLTVELPALGMEKRRVVCS